MERKFYTNNFENLLKENADQFKMYPSKKVWHGIYNDLHPGRRWPSIAMSLFLLFTLVVIGHLNTQQPKQIKLAYEQHAKVSYVVNKTSFAKALKQDFKSNKPASKIVPVTNSESIDLAGLKTKTVSKNNTVSHDNQLAVNDISFSKSHDNKREDIDISKFSSLSFNLPNSNVSLSETENKSETVIQAQDVKHNEEIQFIKKSANLPSEASKIISNNVNLVATNNIEINNVDQKIPEQPKTNNTKILNPQNLTNNIVHFFKRNSDKIRWSYYFSPSVSYRVITKNGSNSEQTSYLYDNMNDYVNQIAAPGFEGGAAFKYKLSKKIKFVSGLQLNYSAYTINANNIHPILTNLTLNNTNSSIPNVVNGISFFSNSAGFSQVKLHNYSFQAAVPIGLEYVISENNYVEFSAAANFQPSYVITNHSYLLSSDKRNYLTNPSLLRNFNMNTSAGLFVTFKTKWMDLQMGPQVRYQLLSTYTKAYPVSEHFINYGIKFGVSKPIK